MDLYGETQDWSVDPNILAGSSLHRDVSTTDDDEMAITIRYPKPYIHKAAKTTQFFSTSDIDILYNNLAGFIHQATHSYNFSQKDYSARFEVLREDGKSIEVTVNIYIVEGQDKYWVQAIKNRGDIVAFYDVYNTLKCFFSGHANTTYSK